MQMPATSEVGYDTAVELVPGSDILVSQSDLRFIMMGDYAGISASLKYTIQTVMAEMRKNPSFGDSDPIGMAALVSIGERAGWKPLGDVDVGAISLTSRLSRQVIENTVLSLWDTLLRRTLR